MYNNIRFARKTAELVLASKQKRDTEISRKEIGTGVQDN